ncbi:hypothetical protein EXN23_02355 [Agrobacterium salinitolerans]|uniref:Uncharacterized protein n=1 Tax=Agrobacterium salinitolerans TaxID=1183413 RepID=A0ABY3BWL8_9HYPH|nr:hypothetical protein C2E26_10055 [Rhizobium sp. YIC5082]TRA97093.1 hypothetical protein EXN23_02355 [Agrobacterium salinitolerans]TZG36357.1 hypothetical protein AGR1_02275 [Agrobacterium sp. B1(2019)]
MKESAEFPRSFLFQVSVTQDSSCTRTRAILSTATENDRRHSPERTHFRLCLQNIGASTPVSL